ncbi:MAG: DUF4349 domain-containing protein [Acidimicrobiales bacterium]|nr:DUF4349 domain-containing protein [Acidimicrobiales bacterium]MCB9393531.1 DUF4349 domain-containing protein [Acidimicrobiaceae bacterium]
MNNHQVRFRPVGAMSVIALVSLLALSACAGDDEDSAGVDPASIDRTAAPPGADEQGEAATADTVAGAASDDGAVSTGGGASTLDPTAGRLLVVDVTVALEVPDVGAALPEVIEIAGRHDGLVYGSDVTLDRDAAGDDRSRGTVTIKLPPAAVEPAIADLDALGDLVGRYQSSDDVTDRVTDVETRIVSAQQSVDRVQQMLAAATDLGEVVMLEGELTARQLVLEELLAAQRNLRNGTELATLTVDLSTASPAEEPEATDVAVEADDDRSIGDAFATGGRAFVTAATAVLMFLGYVAPFLAVALVVAVVARALIRRRPARRSVPLPSPTTPPPAPVAPAVDDREAEPVS